MGSALKKLLFVAIVFSLLIIVGSACKTRKNEKTDIKKQDNVVQKLIAEIEKEPVRNPPAKIYKCPYNYQYAYYVPAYCCDQMSTLYNSNGEIICHPEGGITGKGDGTCDDFNPKILEQSELIWEDKREGSGD